ncbi:MAG TPA: hypothetical protein PK673_06635 [Paludibacteraceae bacterium]|nr:hypothetical protein [Paludibacteraceae bacterium]
MSMFDGAKVLYKLVDPSIAADTRTDTQSSSTAFSDTANLDNLLNKKKGAYLEKNYFVLDGTHTFLTAGDDVGWESANLSDTDGVIAESLTFEFVNTHDSYGLTVNFPTNSFAKDFTITYYSGASVLHTTTVTDNATANYRDNSDVLGWDKIVIAITKVNPQQRARIWSVVFGINEEWNGDDIIKITASKCTDLTAEKVESGEVEFTVYNDGVFDIQDIKDLSPEVQRNIGIEVSFRRSGAYVKFGSYKSAGIQVADKGKLLTISGYDDFYPIGQTYFEIGKIPSAPKSLGAWAEEVAADCGLELEIDASLYNIYSTGYIGYVPHREALRLIAEAGNCILVVDSDGKNYIKPHVPSVYGAITDDNLIADSSEISNADKLDGVVVERYTYALSSTASGLAEIQGIALTGSPQTIWIDYAVYPAVVDSIAASTNITIDNDASVWYSDRAKIVFTGTANETGWITILGYAYGVSTTSYTEGSSGNVKTISNSLITEDSVATSVLAYQWARAENIYKYVTDVYVDSDVNLGDSATYDDNTIYITKITRSIDSDEASETVEGVDA